MKLGLKLWTINTDYYYNEAKKLYQEGIFDYIELYIVPNTLHTIKKWAEIDIPFILHAPHYKHEMNLANPEKLEYNKNIFIEVEAFREALEAKYTIIHAGMNGYIEETIEQLNKIQPVNALIENKPFFAPFKPNLLCRGATFAEIEKTLRETNLGFCLDIGHAICTANSLKIEPYSYLEKFQTLNPLIYHLSGNYISSDMDSHLHIYEGNYDYRKIFSIIDQIKPISIETKKDDTKKLSDFREDASILKKLSII